MNQNILLLKINDAIADVAAAYNKINEKGGTIPADKKLSNMAESISTIKQEGETTILNDKISLQPSSGKTPSYNVNVPSGKEGFTDVTLNASLIVKNYEFESGIVNVDNLQKFEGVDEYTFNTGSDDFYVNRLIADFDTIYSKDTIMQSKIDGNNVNRESAYSMFTGFYVDNLNICDIDVTDISFKKFAAAVLLTNISPKIQTSLINKELLLINYDFIDYAINSDGIIIDSVLTTYGHDSLDIANFFSNYANLSEIINDLPNLFANCIINSKQSIGGWLTKDLKLSFHKFRIFYNINVSIKQSYGSDTTLFVPFNKLDHQIYPHRIDIIKELFKNAFIQSLNDIIDETDVKLSINFF